MKHRRMTSDDPVKHQFKDRRGHLYGVIESNNNRFIVKHSELPGNTVWLVVGKLTTDGYKKLLEDIKRLEAEKEVADHDQRVNPFVHEENPT